ncbi:MAG: L-histidine N(alpha)-methyltransferase [Candidatus Azotimanducaceae bacterium]|uniref:L-histidine N(Alpha)-methyltransferase n=1 Tax=OM182 bacterium TaxID=2510334 RepID=A0A520S5J5_9GAMM|nr:L-histidine N(alpha)-methyltransferase [Gammaproteobacteria bacterium]OUV68395.1 MAG: L-histidine N(alpha)-methyltransferase [Gammaproteobacteria bacterium TMED133]RZO77753.1 MAG: L-histidine N(alpha)-methyltransferase [OM182 bacterium]
MSYKSLHFYEIENAIEDSLEEVLRGLIGKQKMIPPKYFYDEVGSNLFVGITEQPEYYLTRTEVDIFRCYLLEIVEEIGTNCLLIEYGSGNSEKIRVLLESLRPCAYVPLDISKQYLATAARSLAKEYPWLQIHAICLDFTDEFELPFSLNAKRVGFFPGSSIGNFSRLEAANFLGRVRRLVGEDGGMLIGVDLKKDPIILRQAYNDAKGITRAFNLNVLNHINKKFRADFDINKFEHLAEYQRENGCVAMYLSSIENQKVNMGGSEISLACGEQIHTENSHKYSVDEFASMARESGFSNQKVWTDSNTWFGIFYLS